VSAAANATAERQIVATIEAGCRVLGMMSGELYDRKSDTRAANVGPPIARKLVQLPLGTDGALALDDLTHIPQLDAAGAGAFIGSPIDVGGVRYGSLCFTSPMPREKPFGAVERDLVQMMAALIGSAIERNEARTHLNYLAYNDQLTSLPNRASFIDRLRDEVSAATERSARVGVMFLDLDRFKDINDTLGHGFGDQLLRTIGDRLVAAVAPHGTVARMGGDEFIVLVAGDPDADRMTMLAERIVATVDEPVVVEGYEQYVSASIGVAMFPDDGGDADTLIKHADIAMYRAKERGRNTYAFYTPALNASLRARLAQEKSLRKALENGEFIVHYQPQIDLLSQRVVAIEALVRWQHPRLGLVSPDQFIPSAELSGLIVPLGDWILETACRQTRDLQRRGFPDLRVAVNLSARQFHQTQLVTSIREALRRTGLSPHSLELEITESVAMNDAAFSVQIMQELGLAGIRLSVDDFGTGYSSLGYLRRFPLHSIKIDRSFVSDITAEPDDATIVRTVIGMAHSLGLEVIAEGVETRDQVLFLERENCDRVQGFYFAPGLPPDELEIYLARHAAIAGEVRTA
jgi:diguanylate cyclase (GGDEF)-like protein